MHKIVSWMTLLRVILILTVIVPAALYAGEVSTADGSGQQLAALTRQLHEAQDRIARLEQRLAAFEAQWDGVANDHQRMESNSRTGVLRPMAPQSQPQEWRQRMFNGLTYYAIPLGGPAISTP